MIDRKADDMRREIKRCVLPLLVMLATAVPLKSVASELGDAYRFFGDERSSQYKITALINGGKVAEALQAWNAMVDRLNANSHYARVLIANSVSRDDVLDVFQAKWETNKIDGTEITIRDALQDTTLIDRRRKWFFNRYQIPDDLMEAYYSKEQLDGDSPRHLLIPFLPSRLNVDGSPRDGKVTYLTGGFVGRNNQSDERRTAIAVHLWRNRNRYLGYFKNALTARWFFDSLFARMDNPAQYLKILESCEMKISRHVRTYGKITSDEYSDFLPRANRNFRSCKWFSAKISRVVDGDTVVVNPYDGGGEVVVRLDKIDAPEKGQPFGKEAKEYLASWTGIGVTVYYTKRDKYDRILGSVVDMPNNLYLNLRMVSDGFAWHYAEYDSTPEFAEAERDARRYRLNLWSDPFPVRPSEWRKSHVLTDSENANTYGL